MAMCVLVTGVGAGSTGEQVVKALRQGRRDYRIVVANAEPAHAAVVTGVTRLRLPPASAPGYLEALAAAAEEVGARFVVPGSDPELYRIAEGRELLARLTSAVPLVNGANTIRVCSDKAATAAALARAGFRVPRTVECDRGADPAACAREAGLAFPMVLKPRTGGGGSADVHVAQDAVELRFLAGRAARGGAFLLQEYVGDPEHEFTVGVLHDPAGHLVGSFALRRELTGLLSVRYRAPNRTARADLGPWLVVSSGFSQGEVEDFPEVRGAAERIAQAVGSTGPLNVQGRWVNGELVVFEINPRFSGTESIRARAGWNGPEALVDVHLGVPPALRAYRARPRRFGRTVEEFEVR